jgi:transglutaminase-like putative cysteine protease
MSQFSIVHQTTYQYDRPVGFGPWRLMMRPIDSHALRVLDATFESIPLGTTTWAYDVYGNSVCTLQPAGESNLLSVTSRLKVARCPAPLPDFAAPSAGLPMPVAYSVQEQAALQPFAAPETDMNGAALSGWIRETTQGGSALEAMQRLSSRIHDEIRYGVREAYGTQSPQETFERRSGACRDFAWLMIEAARSLGVAARFVTGYLHSAGGTARGAGATHAWCEVYLPGLGWIELDPTNGLVESYSLIRVAATRTPEEASPMQGEILTPAGTTMTVTVDVQELTEPLQPAVAM